MKVPLVNEGQIRLNVPQQSRWVFDVEWRWSVIEFLSNQVGDELAEEQNLHSPRNLCEPEGNEARHRQERIGRSEVGLMREGENEWPAELTISLLQGKWKLRILTQLKHGPIRLSQLRKMFPDASKKMLTLHLRELEQDGIVVRSDLSGRRRHVEYSLETSLGAAVLHLIGTLAEWGSQYAPTMSRQGTVRDSPKE
jgi:DNA-binding HxlR family transcriptional regulator